MLNIISAMITGFLSLCSDFWIAVLGALLGLAEDSAKELISSVVEEDLKHRRRSVQRLAGAIAISLFAVGILLSIIIVNYSCLKNQVPQRQMIIAIGMDIAVIVLICWIQILLYKLIIKELQRKFPDWLRG